MQPLICYYYRLLATFSSRLTRGFASVGSDSYLAGEHIGNVVADLNDFYCFGFVSPSCPFLWRGSSTQVQLFEDVL